MSVVAVGGGDSLITIAADGDAFAQRLIELRSAQAGYEEARDALNIGKDARAAFDAAFEDRELARDTLAKAQSEAARLQQDAIDNAASLRHDAEQERAEARALLVEAKRTAGEITDAAKADTAEANKQAKKAAADGKKRLAELDAAVAAAEEERTALAAERAALAERLDRFNKLTDHVRAQIGDI